jgi:DNA-binding MarR family transcriptional regulator
LVLLRLARRIRSQYRGESTPSQMAVLTTLARHGPSTVGQIAEHEQVRPPSASKIVAALETQGLVARHADPEDRRCALIALTAAGDRLITDARVAGATWLASRLEELDLDELAALADAVPALEHLLGGAE